MSADPRIGGHLRRVGPQKQTFDRGPTKVETLPSLKRSGIHMRNQL